MKLSIWAKKQGISYRTACRWFKEGNLPVFAEKTKTGTILVREESTEVDTIVIYARVSSRDQRNDLNAQIGRLVLFANEKGWVVSQTVAEIGSGLNGHRSKLKKLLANQNIKIILIEHQDRLMRFGIEYVESVLAAQGRRLVIVDSTEIKDDLVQDMIEILTSFCAKLYGRRSAKNKVKKALELIQNAN
jgi:predicted site-specific integrase-resolvase